MRCTMFQQLVDQMRLRLPRDMQVHSDHSLRRYQQCVRKASSDAVDAYAEQQHQRDGLVHLVIAAAKYVARGPVLLPGQSMQG